MAREGKAYVLSEVEMEQFKAFLCAQRHSERNLAIYLLTRRAGLRIGEVSKLKMSDVIDSQGQIKNVSTLRSGVTKGKKVRTAYFNHPELISALTKYISTRPKYKSDYLFVSQKGKEFSPNSMCEMMSNLYHKAGFEGASSHSGRRGAASALRRSGLDIVSLSKVLGHSSISTTQGYIEVDQDKLMNHIKVA